MIIDYIKNDNNHANTRIVNTYTGIGAFITFKLNALDKYLVLINVSVLSILIYTIFFIK